MVVLPVKADDTYPSQVCSCAAVAPTAVVIAFEVSDVSSSAVVVLDDMRWLMRRLACLLAGISLRCVLIDCLIVLIVLVLFLFLRMRCYSSSRLLGREEGRAFFWAFVEGSVAPKASSSSMMANVAVTVFPVLLSLRYVATALKDTRNVATCKVAPTNVLVEIARQLQ